MVEISAVILAGGKGTRLSSVISDRPKVLAEVEGHPFITYLLEQINSAGILKTCLCTGYMADQVRCTCGNSYEGMEITYSEESIPLGTGGAILNGLSKITTRLILVMNGDSYCGIDLSEFISFAEEKDSEIAMVGVEVPSASRYGTIVLDNNGNVSNFIEKNNLDVSGLINAGIYMMKRDFLLSWPQGRNISIEKEIFPFHKKSISLFQTKAPFIDIGTPEDYKKTGQVLREASSWRGK